jgi:hypothetical protein
MIKYFIEASAIFFSCLAFVINILQKAKVFSSRAIHTSIHELLDKTIRLLVVKTAAAIGSIRISISLFTLNCKFKSIVDMHILLFVFLEKVLLLAYPYPHAMEGQLHLVYT